MNTYTSKTNIVTNVKKHTEHIILAPTKENSMYCGKKKMECGDVHLENDFCSLGFTSYFTGILLTGLVMYMLTLAKSEQLDLSQHTNKDIRVIAINFKYDFRKWLRSRLVHK